MNEFAHPTQKGGFSAPITRRWHVMVAACMARVYTHLDARTNERDEANYWIAHIAARHVMRCAMTIRFVAYAITLFAVGWYGVEYERLVALFLFPLLCGVAWHASVGWIFVLATATIFTLCEWFVVHAPAHAWRYRIPWTGSDIAKLVGVPLWSPLLTSIACIGVTDLLRISARVGFMTQVTLPPKCGRQGFVRRRSE